MGRSWCCHMYGIISIIAHHAHKCACTRARTHRCARTHPLFEFPRRALLHSFRINQRDRRDGGTGTVSYGVRHPPYIRPASSLCVTAGPQPAPDPLNIEYPTPAVLCWTWVGGAQRWKRPNASEPQPKKNPISGMGSGRPELDRFSLPRQGWNVVTPNR